MKAFLRLLATASLVATSDAIRTARDVVLDPTDSVCANGAVVSNNTVTLSGIEVQWTSFDCGPVDDSAVTDIVEDLFLPFPIIPWFPFPIFGFPFPPPPPPHAKPTKTSSSVAPTPTTINVCNVPCTDSCGSLGDLPPISEDCQTIYDSINITDGSITPTFDVQSNHIEQLTFGTCRVFFENFSNTTLTYCWTTFSAQAQVAGTDCFPPVQPVNSVGFCSPSDASWQIGVAHS